MKIKSFIVGQKVLLDAIVTRVDGDIATVVISLTDYPETTLEIKTTIARLSEFDQSTGAVID